MAKKAKNPSKRKRRATAQTKMKKEWERKSFARTAILVVGVSRNAKTGRFECKKTSKRANRNCPGNNKKPRKK